MVVIKYKIIEPKLLPTIWSPDGRAGHLHQLSFTADVSL